MTGSVNFSGAQLILANSYADVLRAHGIDEIRSALNQISAKPTTEGLQQMNRSVSADQLSPATVAEKWVKETGLGG